MITAKIAKKEKYFSILPVKVLGLCAILVLSVIFAVSCVDEPSDWLSSIQGELSLSVRVIRRGTGDEIKADIAIFASTSADENANRAYVLKYTSPDTVNGMIESFDGKTVTLSLDGFEGASFDYETENAAPTSLGAYTVDLFTPSAVKEVKNGGTYTEVVTDNATYCVDESGAVREICSSDIRVIIEKYHEK